jgi:hypothetical protein
MPLTDTEVRKARILDKPYKLGDERGLSVAECFAMPLPRDEPAAISAPT